MLRETICKTREKKLISFQINHATESGQECGVKQRNSNSNMLEICQPHRQRFNMQMASLKIIEI